MNPQRPTRLLIGTMSGTSADGVDAALVRIEGTGLAMRAALLGWASVPFSESLQRQILRVRSAGEVALRELVELTAAVTEQYAACVSKLKKQSQFESADIAAIAAHGQTLFHAPPLTMQVFDPALLARRCGVDVVSDLRRADCAAGGQGAPLVPFADWILFRSADENRVLLNLGGISNITILPRGGSIDDVSGFDTGPGNCLSDWLLNAVDAGGAHALRGQPVRGVVDAFLASDYITQPAPKSTDSPQMIERFRQALAGSQCSIEDKLATAAEIVAECVRRQTPADATLIVAGGGVHNQAIMSRLRAGRRVLLTDDLGVPAQAREAIAFAILGAATLDRVPANLPRVTGARDKVVLGAITPRPGAATTP